MNLLVMCYFDSNGEKKKNKHIYLWWIHIDDDKITQSIDWIFRIDGLVSTSNIVAFKGCVTSMESLLFCARKFDWSCIPLNNIVFRLMELNWEGFDFWKNSSLCYSE